MNTLYLILALLIVISAVCRFAVMKIRQRERNLPAAVRKAAQKHEHCSVYYEKGRYILGAAIALLGLAFFRSISTHPVTAFSGAWLLRALPGAVCLICGVALIFFGGGCVAVTEDSVIMQTSRVFTPSVFSDIPGTSIDAVCRVSAGKGGVGGAFFRLVRALLRADAASIKEHSDALLHNGCVSVAGVDESIHTIRLQRRHLADEAISDMVFLCRSGMGEGEIRSGTLGGFTLLYLALPALLSLILTISAPLGARAQIEERYRAALQKAEEKAYGAVYSEFAGLWDIYKYKDSDSWASYCAAMSKLRFERYDEAAKEFEKIVDFKDCRREIYICASGLENTDAGLAARLFESLGDFSDSDLRLNSIDERYKNGIAAYEGGRLAEAAEIFGALRDYADTEKYVTLLFEAADELVPGERNHENLSNKEILARCKKALPILTALKWDSRCAQVLSVCENYIYIYG